MFIAYFDQMIYLLLLFIVLPMSFLLSARRKAATIRFRHTNTRAPAFNFKKAYWDEFEKFISKHPPPPIEEAPNIHCAARSFSSLLLNAAKASIPFGFPKAWWSEEAELAVRDRRRARSEAHRLAYVEASRRASSVISRAKTSRPGRPPATTCLPTQTPVLFSASLTQLLARRVLPATQNCLSPNIPKILPISTLFISAHTSLNKLPGSLVVLSVVSRTPRNVMYARTNTQTHPFTTLSAPPSPPKNLQLLFPNSQLPLPQAQTS